MFKQGGRSLVENDSPYGQMLVKYRSESKITVVINFPLILIIWGMIAENFVGD